MLYVVLAFGAVLFAIAGWVRAPEGWSRWPSALAGALAGAGLLFVLSLAF